MADQQQEVRTQRAQQGDTEVRNQTISTRSKDDGVVKIEKIIYLVLAIITGLLVVRFILFLLGANRSNSFADLIFSITSPLVAPFRGLFSIDTTYGVSRFDIESLIAIIVYGLIALIFVKVIDLGRSNDTTRV